MSLLVTIVVHLGASPLRAQATPEATPEHLQQLETCREGILDESARPQDRRRWVEMLLSYSTPQADALAIELLGMKERSDVRRALCEALAWLGPQNRDRLNPGFVSPLLSILAAESGELRSAAGAALAEFPSEQVADQLGALAANDEAPLPARIAAVDALAPNTHRREVVEQLIALLDERVPEITERVVAALSPIAPGRFGADLELWRSWWEIKSRLSNEAWLAEQLKHYRDRSRQTAARLSSVETDLAKQQSALTERIRGFQRELLRPLTEEQKAAKFAEWMDDPLGEVKQGAVALVRSQIADEGKRPTGEVLAALLRLLDHPTPSIRREVLTIAQNLHEEAVVDAVLARLEVEQDPVIRQAILHAIGRLASPKALPALLRDIQDDTRDQGSCTIAAQAIGRIAAGRSGDVDMSVAVEILKSRYTRTPDGAVELRAALLSAMAGVADPSFAPEFMAALGSDDSRILEPALHGLKAAPDVSRLPRVRSLVVHTDQRIRLAAVDALAALGNEAADLESLLSRLNPTLEPDESVRQTAWRGFRQFLSRRPMNARIAAGQRLREWSDLEAKYLEELANVLSTAGEYGNNLEILRERLAVLAREGGNYDKAIPHLRELYAMRFGRQDPHAVEDGVKWIDAVLRSSTLQNLSEVVVRVAEGSADATARSSIVASIRDYVSGADLSSDPERSARLLVELKTINPPLLGEGWPQLLKDIEAKVNAARPAPSPPGSPSRP